ncbi:ATP-dependent DNA helicase RecG [Arhodomonas aquaeolei]|uniref:ATP-dependent DNA helicase RecG n=1 Tax=Arhodomonas aquaeolei TaxID=2369 RepID=UPI002168C20F|nr:ATP-dependent DNA helicase RecG [Arhodomonas aquaeolei]MCS4505306.1 ATP-dependent DNA helicase RecG [Arhodomonas aquaeolei]
MAVTGPLERAVTDLPRVGPRLAERLARLGLHRVGDLLFHLPLRYEDRTRVVPLGELRPGRTGLIEARVAHAAVVPGRRRRLVCRVEDGTGAAELVFFHFHAAQQRRLQPGTRLHAFGEGRPGAGMLQMVHPEWEVITGDAPAPVDDGLTPVYPTTEGVTQPTLRRIVAHALDTGAPSLPELLPDRLREALSLPPLVEALAIIHRPPPDTPVEALLDGRHPAVRRLAFEELLAHRLSLLRLREAHRRSLPAPRLAGDGGLREALRQALPFALTEAQERVLAEVLANLAEPQAMLRLVQGDVGSGKTVVAALAALAGVEAGCQAAVMAPTELLAEQHFRAFRDWLAPLGVSVDYVSGRLSGRARRDALAALADGTTRVAVGTHALFQSEVAFHALGLVIIDEQHRFGVHQRLALRDKGADGASQPHQLIMTATPIPRTLAMTAYADLDVSVIDELPPGRQPVATVAVPDTRRDDVVQRVRAACAEGRQAYWVCTLVEESEVLEAEAAEERARLLGEALPDLRVGLVHGRLTGSEKEAVMTAFEHGGLDLLVATTVIEVGVDVPNASLMIIENPERLGLAQLHQLRGRVGRGSAASSCVLLYHGPLSETAKARLGVLRESGDGFRIAARDLEIRGPGELLGTRQTGAMEYRIADLGRDADLLDDVRTAASRLFAGDAATVQALIERWVGEGERYAQA